MKSRFVAFIIALFLFTACVWAQEPPAPVTDGLCQWRVYTESFWALPTPAGEPNPWGTFTYSSLGLGADNGASIFFDYPALAASLDILSFDASVPIAFMNGVRVVQSQSGWLPYVPGGVQFEARSQQGAGVVSGAYHPGMVAFTFNKRGYWIAMARNVGYPEPVLVQMRTVARLC